MSRVMVDGSGALEWLVVAARVEREFSDELAVEGDHADALIGDEELDPASLVGSAEPDVVELAHVAQADLAVGIDLVSSDAEVRDGLRGCWLGLDACAV